MAMQILPVLRAMGPLIANAARVVADLRSNEATARIDQRVEKLECETLRAGEVLVGLGEQLQTLAEQVREQAEEVESMQRGTRLATIVSGAAILVALAAAGIALGWGG